VRVAQSSVLRTCQVTDGEDVRVAQSSVLRTCQVTDGKDVRVAQSSVLRTCQVTDGKDVRVAQSSVLRTCQVTDGEDVRIAQGSGSPTMGTDRAAARCFADVQSRVGRLWQMLDVSCASNSFGREGGAPSAS